MTCMFATAVTNTYETSTSGNVLGIWWKRANAIGANVRWRLIENRQTGIYRVIYEERGKVKIDLGHPFECEVKRRHNRRYGDRIDGLNIQLGQRKQIARQHTQFIDSAGARGSQTPMRHQIPTVKNAE